MKGFAILGVILLLGVAIAPSINADVKEPEPVPVINQNKEEFSSLGVNITFTYPENAIYWNDHKIVPFSVPLILHSKGDIYVQIEFIIEPLDKVDYLELYINDVLQVTIFSPPFPDKLALPVPPLSHAKSTIIVGTSEGYQNVASITVWRLFR